jgi:acyl-CoA dehydrogenase
LGEGRGFEIIYSRLGPGRIRRSMRGIGIVCLSLPIKLRCLAKRALEWMIERVTDPAKTPFKRRLSEHGIVTECIARSCIARLIVLNASIKIDNLSAKEALKEIAEAKILVPTTILTVVDRAMQAFGAAGLHQDTPLAALWPF